MEKIEKIKQEALEAIEKAKASAELQQLKVSLLGKKGSIQEMMSMMKDLSAEEKPKFVVSEEVAEAATPAPPAVNENTAVEATPCLLNRM